MINQMRTIDTAAAYEMAEVLQDRHDLHADSASIFKGKHPDLGSIYIVIPPAGGSIILPFEPHSS